jgi:hypothetical protein
MMSALEPFVPLAQSMRRRGCEAMRGAVIGSVPHLVVDDHRWMLPAIWTANLNTSHRLHPLVLLDLHAELSSWEDNSLEHHQLLTAESIDDVLACCEIPGRPRSTRTVHKGNWLAAAMRLGWVAPVVTIGLEGPDAKTNPPGILECGRIDSNLFHKRARWMERRHQVHHDAIGWHVTDDAVGFSEPPDNIYMTVDLDAFAEGGDDGEGMKRRGERDLIRSLAEPYASGLAKGSSFRDTYRQWLNKSSFVLVAMESEIFVGWGNPRQRERAESLLESFWKILYSSVPDLIDLAG